MKITLNGAAHDIKDTDISLTYLLTDQGYDGKLVAVAINGDFVPKSSYGDTVIHNNDTIEIVAPMQGG